MKLLSIAVVSSAVATFASAEFFVVNDITLSNNAKEVCKNEGGELASLKPSKLYSATKALYKAKVGSAWIKSYKGKKHGGRLFLEKPSDFRTTHKEGRLTRAACDSDGVCNDARPVLCYTSDKIKKRGKKSKGKKKGRKGRKGTNGYGSKEPVCEDESCEDDDEDCEDCEVPNKYGSNYDDNKQTQAYGPKKTYY